MKEKSFNFIELNEGIKNIILSESISKNGIDISDKKFLENKLKTESFLTKIYSNKENQLTISALQIRKIYGRPFINIINSLINNSYIINRGYTVGFKSTTYELTDKLIDTDYGLNINPYGVEKCVSDIKCSIRKELMSHHLKMINRFTINHEKSQNILNSIENIKTRNISKLILYNINNNIFKLTTDKSENRIYDNSTYLKSSFRNSYLIDGEHCVNIDICNSQIQFLLIYMDKNNLKYEKEISDIIKSGLYYEMLMDIKNHDRDRVKQLTLMYLFTKGNHNDNNQTKYIRDYLEDKFPLFYSSIENIKRKKINLSVELQKDESDLVLNISLDLFRVGIYNKTIHDSFIVKHSDIKTIEYIKKKLIEGGIGKIKIIKLYE